MPARKRNSAGIQTSVAKAAAPVNTAYSSTVAARVRLNRSEIGTH
jgi:predicted aspartyl protease